MTGLRIYKRDGELPRSAGDEELCVPPTAAVLGWIQAELLVHGTLARVSLLFARWKPGVSLTCAYAAHFADGGSELVGLKRYANGKERLLAGRPQRPTTRTDAARLSGHAIRAGDRLALWAADADRRLPGQALALDARELARRVEEASLVPMRSVRRRRVTRSCLRYKPERRALWRVEFPLRNSTTATRAFALRILPPESVPARVAARRAFEAAGGSTLTPPLALVDRRLGVLLEPWLDLEGHGPEEFEHAAEVGDLLARLHGLPCAPLPWAIDEPSTRPVLERSLFAVDPALARAASGWTPHARHRPAGWVHGDLHPDQIARSLKNGRALLLDLDELGIGDPQVDLASWVADRLHAAPDLDFTEASEELLAGYAAAGGVRPAPAAFALHVADALAARAAATLRRLERGAPEKATRTLQRALALAQEPFPVPFAGAGNGAPTRATRIDRAINLAVRHLDNPGVVNDLERVELDRSGAVELTVQDGARTRWLRVDGKALSELDPAVDARLPLSRALAQDSRHEVLAYRPGRRLVIAAGGTIVKGYRADRAAEALNKHLIAARSSSSHLHIPEPKPGFAGTSSVCFSRIEGAPLTLDKGSTERFFVLGASLTRLQQEVATALSPFTVGDELRILTERASRMRAAALNLPRGWNAAYARVEPDAERLPEAQLGFTHRDLHDGQFLVTDNGMALLDFDLACRADIALDPANLLAHLALRALQELRGATSESVEILGEAFVEGLDRGEDHGFWQRLRFYQTTAFLRLALVYAVRPRWRSLSEPLVRLAEGALRDVERMQPT